MKESGCLFFFSFVGMQVSQAALRQPVADQVLAAGEHALRLHAAGVGAAEDGHEVGILAVRLLGAAPARVTRDVEDGREHQRGAAGGSDPSFSVEFRVRVR